MTIDFCSTDLGMHGYSLQDPCVNSFVSLIHWGFLQPFTEEESRETIIWVEFVDHQYFLMTHQQKHTIFMKHFSLFCKLCFYTAQYSWVGFAGTQDCTSCMMVAFVQYCNIWTKQKHLLALLGYVWISTIVHATDSVCSCFRLEVVAGDGSEMGARKPVI